MRTQIFLGREAIYLGLMEKGSRMVAFYSVTRSSEISTSILKFNILLDKSTSNSLSMKKSL